MDQRHEKGSGFTGEHRATRSARMIAAIMRQRPLLKGLAVCGAGYYPKAEGHLRQRPHGADHTILIYCLKGAGWAELGGHRLAMRAGDLLAIPEGMPHAYGASELQPWTIHWVHALGDLANEYLAEAGLTQKTPVMRVGEDLQVSRLFNEIMACLERGFGFVEMLRASQSLAHLLALLVGRRYEQNQEAATGVEKVAQAIVFMSEHLDQTLKVGALAAFCNLSAAHFTVVFKQETGCSPRDYLNLLRIHRACEWLQGTSLPMKEIAARLGYQDPFHFSRRFKEFQGVSPTEYRRLQMARHA